MPPSIPPSIASHLMHSLVHLFFFFQAEDGIRDRNVTGVQTCALPISLSTPDLDVTPHHFTADHGSPVLDFNPPSQHLVPRAPPRSEERRVGKECRSRWSADQ